MQCVLVKTASGATGNESGGGGGAVRGGSTVIYEDFTRTSKQETK